MKNKLIRIIIVFLACVPLAIWGYTYMNADLWYDEVYSLEHFVLVDFSTTLFYYPAPNNHIFYNLMTQFVSRIFGLRDIFSVEANAFVFRMVQLIICLGCGYYVIQILRKFFHIRNFFLVLPLLFTTIPFMNFSLQLRGYGLSMLLLLMLLYYSWSYIQQQNRKLLVVIILLSTLILYTIPSNLYVLVALCGTIVFFWFFSLRKGASFFSNANIVLLGTVILGVLLAVLLYLPIWKELLYNKFSNKSAEGIFDSFYIMLIAAVDFFSNRYGLLLLILPGLYLLYKNKVREQQRFFMALVLVFIGAFLVSFIHQKAPYARVFIALAPIFVLVMMVPIGYFLESVSKKTNAIIQILVSLYCVGVFYSEMNTNDAIVAENLITHNTISQDLYQNYYLSLFFEQDETMADLAAVHDGNPIFKAQIRDEPSANLYLRKHQLNAKSLDSLEVLPALVAKHDKVFLLTSHANRIVEELKKVDKTLHVEVVTADRFTNIIEISAK